MMSLEGTKTINEGGKGEGLFFVMKDTGWKKHHQKGRLCWENTKNIHVDYHGNAYCGHPVI